MRLLIALAFTCVCLADVHAQSYPTRTVRLIVPFPPGGGTDFVARTIQSRLADALGQQIIIDNRAGASGILGTELASKAPPDGYTLALATSNTISANVALFPKLPYEPLRDFVPVTLIASQPNLLAVHPSLPAKTVRDLVALAKARPGQLNYASSGSGSSHHLSGELFKLMSGTNLVHVPYKGTGPAITDAMGGHVEVIFSGIAAILPQVKAGRLRALAITKAQRSQMLPDLPTIAESGLPGYELTSWHGMLAPAGTPVAIIVRAHGAVLKALESSDVRERFSSQGAEPVGSTPDDFGKFLRADIAKIGKLIRAAGIKAD
ncbi:MAG: Bug family tripartite tricarboxylate transporter substrate binding protein [Burkholderiales bacterium]